MDYGGIMITAWCNLTGISHVIIYVAYWSLESNCIWNAPHLDLVDAAASTDTVDESKAREVLPEILSYKGTNMAPLLGILLSWGRALRPNCRSRRYWWVLHCRCGWGSFFVRFLLTHNQTFAGFVWWPHKASECSFIYSWRRLFSDWQVQQTRQQEVRNCDVLETTQPNMVNDSRVSNSQALVGFKCLTKCSGMPAMVASPLEVPHRLEVVHRMSLMSWA